jgi:hypothetical protein
MRHLAIVLLAAAVIACDKLPTGTPARPSGPVGDAAANLAALAAPSATYVDLPFETFLKELDLPKQFGARADKIADQLRASRAAALKPKSSTSAGARLAAPAAVFGESVGTEFGQKLADSLDQFTKVAATHESRPPASVSAQRDEGTVTNTTLSKSEVIRSSGSRVDLSFRWTLATVTKDASGATLVDLNEDVLMEGGVTVCPDDTGSVGSAVDMHQEFKGVVNGVTTTHGKSSSSVFTGHVDDAAALTNVRQVFQDKQSWDTSSGSGHYDVTFAATYTVHGSSTLTSGYDQSSYTGAVHDADAAGLERLGTAASWDMLLDTHAMTPVYRTAEKLWRNGRCVVGVVSDYRAETPIEIAEQQKPQHDETVDRASETKFNVNLKHRFGGSISAPITANLTSGGRTLTPNRLESSGSLTYKAPDEEDKTATVELKSTSRRGIGTLLLDFHTGGQALTLTISGTLKLTRTFLGTVEVTDTVSVGPVEFKKSFGDFWEGTGTWTAQTRSFVAVAGTTQTCTGSQSGTVTMLATFEDRGGRKVWIVNPLDGSSEGTASSSCPGEINVEADAADQFLGAFDQFVIPEDGGTMAIHGSSGNASFGKVNGDGTLKAQTRH